MSTPRTWVRVGRTTLLTGALALSLAPLAAAPAMAVVPTRTADPGQAAAGWLAAQVDAGTLQPGSLADAVIAFAATGVGKTAATDALAQLETSVDSYIKDGTDYKAGPTGKVLLAVAIAGGDIHSFGGNDLEAALRALVEDTGVDAGHFANATVYEQAIDILALSATPAGLSAEEKANVGGWLASKACEDGDFSYDGTCPSFSPDPDSTAIAIQALDATGETAARDKADAWLLAQQAADGSLASFGTPNSSSTAASGQAFRVMGHDAEADKAAAWTASLQFGCGADSGLIGAIPWAAGGTLYLDMSTTQAMLGAGAGRLDQLTLSTATAIAPTLACPSAPTAVSAAAGAGVATVTWMPPVDDGGSAITSYLVRSAPGGYTCSPRSIAIASCTVTGLPDGRYTFSVIALNEAGASPASAPSDQVTVDTTAPNTSKPTVSLRAGSALTGANVPVKVSWTAPDALSGPATGALKGSTDGGATYTPLASSTATSYTTTLAAGATSYRYEVKATDTAGNASAWMEGPAFSVSITDDASAKVTYRGAWTTSKPTSASGVSLHSTTSKGASASITFSGRGIAWVAPKGTNRGKAAVYLDGIKVKTVDLQAASANRILVYAKTFGSVGKHTLKVVALGTSGHPRVDVDAFVIVK